MGHNLIHPSVLDRLDPEYVAFHNANLINYVPPELLPWDPNIRKAPTVPGTSTPLEVGPIKDFSISKTSVRVYTPKTDCPHDGWPVFIWFHGGGWTLGNLETDKSFITQIVNAVDCVVVSVNYRLAPEEPYPAAVEDAVDAFDWVIKEGSKEININPNRIAVGGSSSGGNLATILALKAAERNIPLVLQLLNVPVTDNTGSVDNLWKENQHGPWLTPIRMEWFKKNYLPNQQDWTKWDASPTFAPTELLRKSPKTWIGVCEVDILKAEGIEYGEKLRKVGVDVEIQIYAGAPHPILSMDGIVLQVGKKVVADAGVALSRAFAQAP